MSKRKPFKPRTKKLSRRQRFDVEDGQNAQAWAKRLAAKLARQAFNA